MFKQSLILLWALGVFIGVAQARVPVTADDFTYGYSTVADTSTVTSSSAFTTDFTVNNWSKGTDGSGTSQRWYIRSDGVAYLNSMDSQWSIRFDLKGRKAVSVTLEKGAMTMGTSNTRRLYQRMGFGYINNKGEAVSCFVGAAGASPTITTPVVLSDVEGLTSVTIFGYVEATSSTGVNTTSSSAATYHQFFRAGSTTATPQFQVHIVSQAADAAPLEPFGIGSHMDETAYYDDAVAAGIQWIRIDTSWYHVEGAGEGVWNFTNLDAAVATAKAQGLKILGIIGYGTSWATSSGDSAVYKGYAPLETYDAAYATYVETLVSRYKDSIDAWEFQNEVDIPSNLTPGTGSWAANHYPSASTSVQVERQYQHMIALAMAKIAPYHVTVTTAGFAGGGSSNIEGFMDDMLTLNPDFYDVFDVYNCHGYSLDTMLSQIAEYGSIKSKSGMAFPLWITETGITVLNGSTTRSDKELKSYVFKTNATALGGGADKLFWYRLKGTGTYAALMQDGSRTAIFDAYKLLTTEWANPVSVEAWTGGNYLTGAVAERADGAKVAILWATYSFWSVTLSNVMTGTMTAVDVDGNSLAGSYKITNAYPIILRMQAATPTSSAISGSVTLNNYSTAKVAGTSVTFETYQSGTLKDTQTVALGSGGSYALTVPVTGSFTVYAKASHWLRQMRSASDGASVNFSLVNGDINADNNINVLDYAQLQANYNKVGVTGNPCDLNGDNNVNVLDYTILKNNYNKVGD